MRIERSLQHTINDRPPDFRSPIPLRAFTISEQQTHGNRRNTEKCRFDRRGHRTRIDHVDPDVGAAVHSTDCEIRTTAFTKPVFPELTHGELHTVRRSSVHCDSPDARHHLDFGDHQGFRIGNAMTRRGLNRLGRDHDDLPEALNRLVQRTNPRSHDAVIVRQQDAHSVDSLLLQRASNTYERPPHVTGSPRCRTLAPSLRMRARSSQPRGNRQTSHGVWLKVR